MRPRIPALLTCALLFAPAAATAQSLADRIARAPADAVVRFSFESKPGVCGDGENIRFTRDGIRTLGRGDLGECIEGPVRLELTRRGGDIADVDVRVGGEPRSVDIDLGSVAAANAVDYLLSDAALRSARAKAAQQMIFATTLANAESWPALLRLARNRDHAARTRESAIFWLSTIAGDRATEGLRSIAGDDSDEIEVRRQAIFAIAQQRTDESIDVLIDIARTNREPEIRRHAFFWLGQSGSPRALAFFEEILKN